MALQSLLARPGEAPLAAFERDIFVHLPRLIDRLRQALEAGPVTADDLPESLRARWVAADGNTRLEVRPRAGTVENQALLDFGRAVLAVAPNAIGAPITISEASQAVIGAFLEASLIAAMLILLLLGGQLRNLRDLVLVLTPLALAGLLTAAFAVALGIALNFANLIALPLLLGLGVASGLHLVLRHREEAGDGVRLMASSTPRAVLFSELTTVSSFGSLALSGHPGMISMGVLLTIALAMTLLSTLLLLPALLARPHR